MDTILKEMSLRVSLLVLGLTMMTLPVTPVTSEDPKQCDRLYFHGLYEHDFPLAHFIEGVFQHVHNQVFIHDTAPYVIVIANDLVEISSTEPSDVTFKLKRRINNDTWLYFNPVSAEYEFAGKFELRCAPESMQQCSSEKFFLKNGDTDLPVSLKNTVFALVPHVTHNHRRVYSDTSRGGYLFYGDRGEWQIADKPGGAPLLRSRSHALHVDYIDADWEVRKKKSWRKKPELRLVCKSAFPGHTNCSEMVPCLNDATCRTCYHQKYCLCPNKYYREDCSEVRPECPSPTLPQNAQRFYGIQNRTFYLGEQVVVNCQPGSTLPFVRLTCQSTIETETDVVVTWSASSTCRSTDDMQEITTQRRQENLKDIEQTVEKKDNENAEETEDNENAEENEANEKSEETEDDEKPAENVHIERNEQNEDIEEAKESKETTMICTIYPTNAVLAGLLIIAVSVIVIMCVCIKYRECKNLKSVQPSVKYAVAPKEEEQVSLSIQ